QRQVRIEKTDVREIAGRQASECQQVAAPGSHRWRGRHYRKDDCGDAASLFSAGGFTSPHCARLRSTCSITTSASMASAMGVARMPTQGSWRPLVMTSTGLLWMSMDWRGLMIEL